jgi:hypothetical protein
MHGMNELINTAEAGIEKIREWVDYGGSLFFVLSVFVDQGRIGYYKRAGRVVGARGV